MTGSPEQIRAAINGLLPRLRRFARTITFDPIEADNLVLAALVKARADHERAPADIECWLFGLVRAASLKAAAPPHLDDVEPASIEHALKRLPEEQRVAVALTLIEGLSYARAAQAMDVSVLTFINRLARGREALQAVL